MATISVTFTALPVHVRTARLVAVATARRAGVGEDLVDEIRFAVGEACSRAVRINSDNPEPDPVELTLTDEQDRFIVEVRDNGSLNGPSDPASVTDFDVGSITAPDSDGRDSSLPDPLPSGFGLAVINGLVEQVAVSTEPDGTRVSMTWPLPPTDPLA